MTDHGLYTLIVVSVILIGVLALAVLLIFNFSQKRIVHEMVKSHQMEMDYQEKVLASSIDAQENERSRIAKDLHDDIGGQLSIVNLNLSLLENSMQSDDPNYDLLKSIRATLQNCSQGVRHISHDLLPPMLSKFGLKNALEALGADVMKASKIEVIVDLDDEWTWLEKKQELHLYRIIQELFQNTIKHADATQIAITSNQTIDSLTLVYSDNGKGIETSTLKGGLGMSSMASRAKMANADFSMIPHPELGMSAKIIIKKNQNDV